ncbi:MAG: lipid-A-disaccharide synthase N-terminal domain-containing protein [Verrucomicrobiales bacterium]
MTEALMSLLERFNPHPWKIIGLIGAAMFGCRWVVQAWVSKRAGRSVIPLSFWLISLTGSLLTLLYFIFYRVDSVGILNNLPPFLVALYNLRLALKKQEAAITGAQV